MNLRITRSEFLISLQPECKSTIDLLTGQSWCALKPWYTGGGPEQGFLYCFADRLNPLNPGIKIEILILFPYSFPITVVGEVGKTFSKFILCDHVLNSHDHSVLQSIDITRRNLMLISLRA